MWQAIKASGKRAQTVVTKAENPDLRVETCDRIPLVSVFGSVPSAIVEVKQWKRVTDWQQAGL